MDIYALARRTVALGIPGLAAADVRMPARHAACSVYAPETAAPTPDAFPDMLGVPAVRAAESVNGWLLLSFTDEFYDACVRHTLETLPPPENDMGSPPLGRMLLLSRQAGVGCPQDARIQRALWLLLGAAHGHVSPAEAAQAFSRMLYALPVGRRMEMRRACGQMADAGARLYARALAVTDTDNN